MNNFLRRTLTGAWIVIFVLGGFWIHPVTFFLSGLVLVIGTQYEYHVMIRKNGINSQMIIGIITGISAYVVSTLIAAGILQKSYFLILILILAVMMITELYRKEEKPFDNLAHTLFAVVYTALPFSMFPFSAFSRSGLNSILPHQGIIFSPGIVIGFFLLIWANDTGAYLTGMSLGKHTLMERISPKKTWEGFIGGILIACIVAWLISSWLGVVDKIHWVIIALIISVSGTLGDLVESMLKRSTGVKDSGSILPGHGGFLDRFDSTIMSFPLVYLYIVLSGGLT